jgi:hypothetical protein
MGESDLGHELVVGASLLTPAAAESKMEVDPDENTERKDHLTDEMGVPRGKTTNKASPRSPKTPKSSHSHRAQTLYSDPNFLSKEKKCLGKYDALSPIRQSRNIRRPWRENNQPTQHHKQPKSRQKPMVKDPDVTTPANTSWNSSSNPPPQKEASRVITPPSPIVAITEQSTFASQHVNEHSETNRGVSQTPIIISSTALPHKRAPTRPSTAKLTRKELSRQPRLVHAYGTPAQRKLIARKSNAATSSSSHDGLRVKIPSSASHIIPQPPDANRRSQQQQQRPSFMSPRRSASPRRAPLQDKVVHKLREACRHRQEEVQSTVTVSRNALEYVLDICDIQHRVVRARHAEDAEMLHRLGVSLRDTGTRVLRRMQIHRQRLTSEEQQGSEEKLGSVVRARILAKRALSAASMAEAQREPVASLVSKVMVQHMEISSDLLSAYALASKEGEQVAVARIESLWDELQEIKRTLK